MTTQISEDDDAWDDVLDDDFLDDDEFEDQATIDRLKTVLKIPDDWYLMQIRDFDKYKLSEIQNWCAENCRGAYRRVNWGSGCSTSIGIALADGTDAVFFKLRWHG